MKEVRSLKLVCKSNSDFNCVINRDDIMAEMNAMGMGAMITSEADWIQYAIEHVIYDNDLADSDMDFICSDKCLSVDIFNKPTGDNISITKLF